MMLVNLSADNSEQLRSGSKYFIIFGTRKTIAVSIEFFFQIFPCSLNTQNMNGQFGSIIYIGKTACINRIAHKSVLLVYRREYEYKTRLFLGISKRMTKKRNCQYKYTNLLLMVFCSYSRSNKIDFYRYSLSFYEKKNNLVFSKSDR